MDDQSHIGVSYVHCIAVMGHTHYNGKQLSGYNSRASKGIIISFPASDGQWCFPNIISLFYRALQHCHSCSWSITSWLIRLFIQSITSIKWSKLGQITI